MVVRVDERHSVGGSLVGYYCNLESRRLNMLFRSAHLFEHLPEER